MGERAPVSAEQTLVRYDNPVLVTKQPEKVVSYTFIIGNKPELIMALWRIRLALICPSSEANM